ncbi:Pectate lyase [Daejeonella rubra]|uniref:Pectate lyase n=1 Tax=Daejeonella rubra TaxID=990371 RepID=A0A1G9QRH7_9SPHI|nr:pectate lyase [Daejeonella rubra]SDM13638.1 Pectate lyase [Daejeonella rubra]
MRKNSLKTKGLVTALLLTIIFFAQCKKDDVQLPGSSADSFASTTAVASTTTATTEQGTLDLLKVIKESGYAYYLDRKFIIPGDSQSSPTSSTLKLYENGKELGPAHASHKDIRNSGKGRFSHWDNSLYFSSSDNTDPRKNGRIYTFTIGDVSGTITAPVTTEPAPTEPVTTAPVTTVPVSTTVPIGYAMVNGSTTGGQGGQTVTVTNLSDFKAAAKSSSPLIIQVSGNFTSTGMIDVASNKTIIGLNGATLNGVGLALYRVNNIIIKNLKINKVIGGDGITIKETSHHIWVDHCEIWQDRTHGWDYYDELLEVTDRSTYVTISNNKFHDSHIAFLIGSGDAQTTDIGYLKVTMYGNYFYNISERQPSTRFGYMHVFNNYFNNGSGYTVGVTMGATVRTDNNYFENQANPIYTEYNAKPGYVSGASTNFYKNSGTNKISTPASTWVPTYEYKSVLIPAADVAARVLSEAGPKY